MSSFTLETLRSFWRGRLASLGLIQRVFIGLIVLNLLVIGLGVWSITQSRAKYDEGAAVETGEFFGGFAHPA